MSDFGYGIGSSFQQHLCIGDTDGNDILHGRHLGIPLKVSYEPADAHASGNGIFFNADIRIIIIVKILSSDVHLGIEIFVAQISFFGNFSVNCNQQLP